MKEKVFSSAVYSDGKRPSKEEKGRLQGEYLARFIVHQSIVLFQALIKADMINAISTKAVVQC